MVHGDDGSVPRTLVPCLGPLQSPAEASCAPGRHAGGLARDGRRVSGGLSELRVIGPVCPVCHRCSREHWSPLEAIYVLLDVGSALVLPHCNTPLTASLLCHLGQDMGCQCLGPGNGSSPPCGVCGGGAQGAPPIPAVVQSGFCGHCRCLHTSSTW